MIKEEIAQEILDEIFSSLEALETQSAAILQFLKDKGIAGEKELAIHFEQAGNASSVKWRAARVHIDHLLSSAIKAAAQETPQPAQPKSSENKQEPPAKTSGETPRKDMEEASSKREPEKEIREKVATPGKSEIKEKQQPNASAGNNRKDNNRKENDKTSKSPEHAASSAGSEDAGSRKTA